MTGFRRGDFVKLRGITRDEKKSYRVGTVGRVTRILPSNLIQVKFEDSPSDYTFTSGNLELLPTKQSYYEG